MENKINIEELLKDCPKGMELDCTIWDNVVLDHIDMTRDCPIYIRIKGDGYEQLTKYGQWNHSNNAKCVIFPKGKTTWEGFQRPFKDGDILTVENESNPFIFYCDCDGFYNVHCALLDDDFISFTTPNKWTSNHRKHRLATEEEKQKLFQAIKDNGYKWNEKTKTLEKLIEPKFKVGDRIVKRNSISNPWIISSVSSEYYGLKLSKGSEDIGVLTVSEQDEWELVPNKFDITTLKPFESRVLVRSEKNWFWMPAIFGFYNKAHFFVLGGTAWSQCIPYNDDTKHLLGTTDDCDNFYKTWE